MKPILIFLLSLLFSFSLFSQKLIFDSHNVSFNPQNALINIEDEKGNILKVRPNKDIISLQLKAKEPYFTNAFFKINNEIVAGTSSFLITNSTIKITFCPYSKGVSQVSGGENDFINKHYYLYLSLPNSIAEMGSISSIAQRTYKMPKLENLALGLYWKEYESNVLSEIKSHSNMFFALHKLYNEGKEYLFTNTLEKCYSLFSDTLKKTRVGRRLYSYIESRKIKFIGEQLPPFNALDINGDIVPSSAMYSGKYTFIDFWASWCGPCRKGMMDMRKFYQNEIDTSKLDVVVISIDAERDKWIEAMRRDSITWKSYIDPEGAEGKISQAFNLTYIPQNILIDKNGKIVETNLEIEGLKSILRTINAPY